MRLRIHWFQHVPFEGLGSLESWAGSRDATLSVTRWYAGDPAPDLRRLDWLVVMGGPMGVYDEPQYPWLAEEKRCLRRALDAGKPVLGVCLGAQLIACVLGAAVRRNPHREIGWFPVDWAARSSPHPLAPALPPTFDAFHWHGDTFDLPPGATPLARSAACVNQAFAIGSRVVGLQFHLETTPASAAAMIAACPGDLAPGPFVQPASELVREPARFDRLNALATGLLDHLRPEV
jgi:GMP synthase (glutamine-hydrolysing)